MTRGPLAGQRLNEDNADPEARLAAMRSVNPANIPRNHFVKAALDAAVARQDFAPFEEFLEVLSRPYEDRPGYERYALPPAPEERVQTFCGT
jgi:serine/tyrosine/threonine adenylyltransferase